MIARLAVVFACAVALSGCLSSSTIIRVKADGSGTIEQTLLIGIQNIDKAFAGMGLKSTGESKTERKTTPATEADIKKDLGRLGDGVAFVSMTPIKLENGFEGVTARFAFDDISKLRTEDFLMPGPAAGEMKKGDAEKDGIRFAMARNPDGTSTLTATFHEVSESASGSKKSSKGGKAGPGLEDPELREMVTALFKGFRIAVDLEIIGQIVRTNADHVDGKRITLAAIDMEALLRDTKKLEALDKVLTPEASIVKMRPYLKDIKGLKINHPVVTVDFR
jgi:hypothetical protein